jgi:voltage-gated potassium channel
LACLAGRPLTWRQRLYVVIFEADTPAGRLFDEVLIAAILASLMVVVMDSVEAVSSQHHGWLNGLEWVFTALFTLEYLARLVCAPKPLRYAVSFFGVIDLLAILPTYLALLVPELHALVDVRVLRLLRIFRVFKLTQYVAEYTHLGNALRASARKILVFLSVVLMVVMVIGTLMYVVEGPENGYTSIPVAVYWAITTITTVGFGDITPKTDLGRLLSSVMMLMGWGVLAVPTGIVTAEMVGQNRLHPSADPVTTRTCPHCLTEGLGAADHYCRHCGTALPHYTRGAPGTQDARQSPQATHEPATATDPPAGKEGA